MAGLMVVGKRIARGADTRASVGDQWSGRRGGLPFVRIRCLSGPNAERADLLEKEQAVRDRGEGEDDATDTSQESERDDVAEAGDEVRKEDGGGQGDMPAEATEADPAPGKAERQAKGRRGELVAHEAREGRRTFLGSRRMAGSRAATRRTRQIRVSSMTKSGEAVRARQICTRIVTRGEEADRVRLIRVSIVTEGGGNGSRSPDPRQHHGEADRARRIHVSIGAGSGEAGRARRIRRDIAAGGGEAGRARQIRISRITGRGEAGHARQICASAVREGVEASRVRQIRIGSIARGGEAGCAHQIRISNTKEGMEAGHARQICANFMRGGGEASRARLIGTKNGNVICSEDREGDGKRRGASGTIVAGRKEGEIYDPRHLSRAGSAEGKGRMGACVSLTRSARKDGWGGKAMGSKAGSAEKQGCGQRSGK
ncbi:unnamed protein product [Closterium sp. NIES-64]|nr:unnamed protein product [Closterium sp. NIES-64]